MSEFFKGWKRKIGVVTLVMALVAMGGWVRSLTVDDQFDVPSNGKKEHCFFHSVNGEIVFTHLNQMSESWSFPKQDTVKWESREAEPLPEDFETSFDWRIRWLGFGVGKLKLGAMGTATMTIWIIPYWSVTIPLTALSAFLLLSKPRKLTPMKLTEAEVNEGA